MKDREKQSVKMELLSSDKMVSSFSAKEGECL